MQECILPSFGVLTSEQTGQINASSHLIRYRKGSVICQQGHPISHALFLKSGLVKTYCQYQDDKNSIIGIIGSGNFICIMSIFNEELYQTSTSALEDSEVIHVRLDIFLEIIRGNGSYAFFIMKQMSRSAYLMVDKIVKSSYKQVPGKIAELLLLFSREFYKSDAFDLPMSRQEIADFISATKETVSRTLGEFKNDRIIEIEGRSVTLTSIDLLDRLSKIG